MAKKSKKDKNVKEKNRSFIELNRIIRTGIIVFVILVLAGGVYLLYSTMNKKFIEQKIPAYSYNNSAKVSYSVSLLPNILYSEKNLAEGKTYITDYIDSINTKLNYEFKGDGPAEITGKYSVVAMVEGLLAREKDSKILWTKEYILQPETSFSGSGNTATLNKDMAIRINQYNSFVQQVMEATKINFDSKLTIKWIVTIESKTDKGVIKEELTPAMEIPLNSKFFEIGGNLATEKKGAVEENVMVISPVYQNKLIISYSLIGICVLVLLFLLIFTSSKGTDDPLEKQLKQIFKLHGDRMVALSSELDASTEKLIQVKTIDDLIRISDDVGKPILYSNRTGSGNLKKFYVIDEKLVYTLCLKSSKTKPIVIDETGSSLVSTEV